MSASTVLAVREQTSKPSRPAGVPASPYNLSIGHLRAFIVWLVVAHPAVLAYIRFAPQPPSSLTALPRIWQAFPVVDPERSDALGRFAGFHDMFFMALMFFLSGLLLWRSLERKGPLSFLGERALRLGLPFVGAAAVVAPLACYPIYIQSGGHGGLAGYWQQWRALGNWPAGPARLGWVLLAFDTMAALSFLLVPRRAELLDRFSPGANRHPILFFVVLTVLSGAAYVPLAVRLNPLGWSAWGPFVSQTSRALHYLVYFFPGMGIGAYGLKSGFLARDGKLRRRWWLRCLASLAAFAVGTGVAIAAMTVHLGSRAWEIAGDSTFVLSSAASSFAFLALFARFAGKRSRIFDGLNENAYGIYLVHYAFASWMQFALLKLDLPAAEKAAMVFVAAGFLSWGTVALIRQIHLGRLVRRGAGWSWFSIRS